MRSPRECAADLMRSLGMIPDPWQVQVLESAQPRLLLNCCRQAGKSTTVAVLALAEIMFNNGEGQDRSEEHTSELQSHLNLVCRLLLEKKKKKKNKIAVS